MLRIDIVEKGDKLELVEQDEERHCNAECKTIERACQEVIGYADTDVAEFVYKNNPSVDQLMKFICKDLSKACAKDPPSVPKVQDLQVELENEKQEKSRTSTRVE